MNKPKAMADRTPREFADHIENVLNTVGKYAAKNRHDEELIRAFVQLMRDELDKPAQNPFTDDQLAWMRETQRCGFNYAAKEANGTVYFFEIAPTKRKSTWYNYAGDCTSALPRNFLQSMLSWEDDEPLCFADYAPLEEGEPKEAAHVQED